MISGAAYSSEPQRVRNNGDSGSIERERPKSLSLINGVLGSGRLSDKKSLVLLSLSWLSNGCWVRRMSIYIYQEINCKKDKKKINK